MKKFVGAVFAALVLSVASASAAAAGDVTIEPSVMTTGTTILVQGVDYPPGSVVTLQICGNSAIDGSLDCDQGGTVSAGVGENGAFSMTITVTAPPTPCPCVLRVNSNDSLQPNLFPITIVDLPTATAMSRSPDVGSLLAVASAELEGTGPWQSWFGGAPERTLVLHLVNMGDIVLTDPRLNVTRGKGNDVTEHVATLTLDSFQPREERTVRIPVRFDALSWGEYTVQGSVVGFGPQASFKTTTSTYWWGWLVVLLVIANIMLFKALRAHARRSARRREEEEALREPGSARDAEPAVVSG